MEELKIKLSQETFDGLIKHGSDGLVLQLVKRDGTYYLKSEDIEFKLVISVDEP